MVVFLITGWNKSLKIKSESNELKVLNFITVLIPVRNEANTITLLLHDILKQSYIQFEVIVVDDGSEDETSRVVSNIIENEKSIEIRLIQSRGEGKKIALSTGVKQSQGSILVTVDADCRVERDWLSVINSSFQSESIKLAFGGVSIETDHSFFSTLQNLEFTSLIGSGASTLALGFPTMCNGANLAFRKDAFYEVNGYSDNLNIPSGDDEFLLRKIAKLYPNGICFLNNQNAVVSTKAQASLFDFTQQRVRWAGKWKHNQSFITKLVALFVFVFQLSSIVSLAFVVIGIVDFNFLLIWIPKILLDYFFLRQVNSFLKSSWSWPAFILLQVIYPFYVVSIGLLSNFRSFEWKGRKLKSIQKKPILD